MIAVTDVLAFFAVAVWGSRFAWLVWATHHRCLSGQRRLPAAGAPPAAFTDAIVIVTASAATADVARRLVHRHLPGYPEAVVVPTLATVEAAVEAGALVVVPDWNSGRFRSRQRVQLPLMIYGPVLVLTDRRTASPPP